jgi:adenine-specific DNA-methyltransferase
MVKAPKTRKVESLTHNEARRINVPTAELQSLADQQEELAPRPPKHYPRAHLLPKGETRDRDPDLDPQIVWNGVKISLTKDQLAQLGETGTVEIGDAQLVWRGKDRQDWSDLIVNVPMLYVQEKLHPKAIIDDLKRQTNAARETASDAPDLFADFNGLTDPEARAEFYQHAMHWQNRMILGDSLQVMASLAEREGLRGKVQCIYFDPPYGIRFGSNWQVSTLTTTVKDGKPTDVTREPEQVKAFRDTWKDGIHSYLTYLRDRLTVARELLTESGSIFVQIGDENVHRVRSLMDEVFGEENFFSLITLKKLSPLGTGGMANVADHIVWYAKNKSVVKFRPVFLHKRAGSEFRYNFVETEVGRRRRLTSEEDTNLDKLPADWRYFAQQGMLSAGYTPTCIYDFEFQGRTVKANERGWSWKTNRNGMERLIKADRLMMAGRLPYLVAYHADNPLMTMNNIWIDSGSASTSYEKVYVVQTSSRQVQKCILMSSDPGDLVLDPTCGSGTTATVAEQWGRRWITIDTSRVALALARTRLMSARYPYYLLADSSEGREKEQEITGRFQADSPTQKDIRQGFVYERAPHITLKSIANNAEIDVIWETWQRKLAPLREALNAQLKRKWEEWQIPRDAGDPWPEQAAKQYAIANDKEVAEKRRAAALGSGLTT